MSFYTAYLEEIEKRKDEGLNPKPIEDGALVAELIEQIRDSQHQHRNDSLEFFIYNTLPGTTSAASVKAEFLKEIILGSCIVEEISSEFAFELLSHMKGGPSIKVLLDLALGDDPSIARLSGEIMKSQVFLYAADTDRLKTAYAEGNSIAREVVESYAKAEFFTALPQIEDEIKVVTYVAAEGDISTDLLSPGNQAHSRSDRELHGKCMISQDAQLEIQQLQKQHPEKRVMLVAEKGTMGVGSSRMSGVNNVALWTGQPASPYIPFVNIAPVIAGTNGISPIFLTTVGVTGGIGIDLKNWVKKLDSSGQTVLDQEGNPILEQAYKVDTGTVFTINTKDKKLYNEDGSRALVDISESLTPQKVEFIRAKGSYAIVFGKKITEFCERITWDKAKICLRSIQGDH
jgi:aconitate hydratase 2/2-methylisocitrate dehydratase